MRQIKVSHKLARPFITTLLLIAFVLQFSVLAVTYEDLMKQKETAHEIAEKARAIGLSESHQIILSAKELWNEAELAIQNEAYEIPLQYTEQDVSLLAKVAFCEARGIKSKTEIACVMWTILNRCDKGYGTIRAIVTAPNQFSYYASAPTISGHGYDLKALARDVLYRWSKEKSGATDVGRVLPKEYLYFTGDGVHNYFRNKASKRWNYSLPTPYEN